MFDAGHLGRYAYDVYAFSSPRIRTQNPAYEVATLITPVFGEAHPLPADLTLTQSSSNLFRLSWTPPEDARIRAWMSYQVRRAPEPLTDLEGAVPISRSEFFDRVVDPGLETTYHYNLRIRLGPYVTYAQPSQVIRFDMDPIFMGDADVGVKLIGLGDAPTTVDFRTDKPGGFSRYFRLVLTESKTVTVTIANINRQGNGAVLEIFDDDFVSLDKSDNQARTMNRSR